MWRLRKGVQGRSPSKEQTEWQLIPYMQLQNPEDSGTTLLTECKK
jgi:hypothetical protein